MNSKILIIIIIILLVVIIGGAYYFFVFKPGKAPETGNQPTSGQEATGPTEETPLSEQPNQAKFNEYLTNAYLGKLPGGAEFNPWAVEKTKNFITSDQFCSGLDIKKDIATGTIAIAIYDVVAKQYARPKGVFPMLLKQGGSIGCEPLSYPAGKYEYKIYLDNVLAAVLPFEVK